MKIMYDYQIMNLQRYGGISRYFYELATGMEKEHCDVTVKTFTSINYYFQKIFKIKRIDLGNFLHIRGMTKIISILNQKFVLVQKKDSYDIIHPTYYNPYIIGKFHAKLVITVYDMIHERFLQENKTMLRPSDNPIISCDNSLIRTEIGWEPKYTIYDTIDEMFTKLI